MIESKPLLEAIDRLVSYAGSAKEFEKLIAEIRDLVVGKRDFRTISIDSRLLNAIYNHLPQAKWSDLPEIIEWRRNQLLVQQAEEAQREQEEMEERQRQQAEKAQLRESRVGKLSYTFECDFLSADSLFREEFLEEGLISQKEYQDLKADYVCRWVSQELGTELDREQAAAVSATEGNILVTARAGSGKTRTLVARAAFLQKHCGVSPQELLLLAFNRNAAEEMKTRLGESLGDALPHVMTFHALAHALVKPQETLLYDDENAGQIKLSKEVDWVIEEHIKSENYNGLIRCLMMAYFREDQERIVDGQLLSKEEFVSYRKRLARETLAGQRVNTFVEKVVANVLFENDISCSFQHDYFWSGFNYRPDFIIWQKKVVIECFGEPDDDDFDVNAKEKRDFWSSSGKKDWVFIEVSLADCQHRMEEFTNYLLRELQVAGVKYRRLTEDEVWDRVRPRAVDRFTEAMKNFINRSRIKSPRPGQLESLVADHSSSTPIENQFLQVAVSVYRQYLQRLAERGNEDFSGLMWRATDAIARGQTSFVRGQGKEEGEITRLRYVMIDEFQDFSEMFYGMVSSIGSVNPDVRFFCVGDNWQAINAFAGSELRFFDKFEEYFDDDVKLEIVNNYRSGNSIVQVGNDLMAGRGTPARPTVNEPGNVLLIDRNKFYSADFAGNRNNGREVARPEVRLVWYFLSRGLDVVLLSRSNQISGSDLSINNFLSAIRNYVPQEYRQRVTVSTAHSYKGREKQAVIVLDADERRYPLIHPSWIFLRLFGENPDKIEDEERRLFYVALTRAKESLAIITDSTLTSPFLRDICKLKKLTSFQQKMALPLHREVRASDSFHVRDILKLEGYTWDESDKSWYLSVPEETFDFGKLSAESWASKCNILVYSDTGELVHESHPDVLLGEW